MGGWSVAKATWARGAGGAGLFESVRQSDEGAARRGCLQPSAVPASLVLDQRALFGRAFGGRNHTTVLHAYKRTAERIAGDRDAYETVQRLTEALRDRA